MLISSTYGTVFVIMGFGLVLEFEFWALALICREMALLTCVCTVDALYIILCRWNYIVDYLLCGY